MAFATPYFIFNALEFGHPLKTGYDFWVPAWTESQRLFSLRNVPTQLVMIWSEITASWQQYRVANIFGTGTYVVPAFTCLCALGLVFVRATRFAVSAFLAGSTYFVATLAYAFIDGRFYCYSRLWRYGKAEAIRLVQRGLDHAIPVYALLLPSNHDDPGRAAFAVDPGS